MGSRSFHCAPPQARSQQARCRPRAARPAPHMPGGLCTAATAAQHPPSRLLPHCASALRVLQRTASTAAVFTAWGARQAKHDKNIALLPSNRVDRAAPDSATAMAVSITCCRAATTEDGCSTLATTSAVNRRSNILALCRSGAAIAALNSACAIATSSTTNWWFSALSSPAKKVFCRKGRYH